jgi:hypothetical protein
MHFSGVVHLFQFVIDVFHIKLSKHLIFEEVVLVYYPYHVSIYVINVNAKGWLYERIYMLNVNGYYFFLGNTGLKK